MKVLKKIIDVDEYNIQLADIIIHPNENKLVFIDTNILIWMFRLNNQSFLELSKLLDNLAFHDCLVIPIWAIHEYNNLLNSNAEIIFSPFKKQLKSLETEINKLEELGRLLVDDFFSKKHGYKNKKEFIEEIKQENKSLIKKITLLSDKNNFNNDERRTYIEDLITKNSSRINTTDLLSETSKFDFRFEHKIPPGFEDELKPNNKYGDLLIWKDIMLNSIKKSSKKCLFISLDIKKDWVYSPQKLILNKEIKNNTGKFTYITPWLEQEFHDITGSEILFSNIKQLIDILYSPDLNPMDFGDFKGLAKTTNIELVNNETNKIIDWLIINEEHLSLLTNTICKWNHSPDEVNIDKLKNWIVENITIKIDFQKVNWDNIFLQLFI